MGAYVTKAGLIAQYSEQDLVRLTDHDNVPPTTIDDAVVNTAIADAESYADTYLRSRHALPLPTVPAVLVRHVGTIAWWYLTGPNRASEADRGAYEDARKWLEAIAAGKATLVEADGDQVAGGKADVRIAGPDRIMTTDNLQGY